MTPGAYIRARREADGLTRDDVAFGLESEPAIGHFARAEVLRLIEADVVPVSISAAAALHQILSIDLELLAELVEAHPADLPAPRLRRAARAPMLPKYGGEVAA